MFLFHVFIFVLMALSICSINVNGIKEKHKHSQVFSSLRAENCDIYLLQETHVQSVQEGKLWERDWGGQFRLALTTQPVWGFSLTLGHRLKS